MEHKNELLELLQLGSTNICEFSIKIFWSSKPFWECPLTINFEDKLRLLAYKAITTYTKGSTSRWGQKPSPFT